MSQWSTDVEKIVPSLVEIRRDLHRHPELGFEERRTQALVRHWLEALGYRATDCAETGLIADVKPELHGVGTTIALRADLDCLPMHETTDLPWRSTHDGRAHKCGHDGHTAILLGVAALLAHRRQDLPGNVRLLFQPAEEGVRGGGARVMVAEGALEGVGEVYGLHNWPGYPRGSLRVRAGAMLAATHTIHIEVRGKGGHGSQPQLARDSIAAGAHLVTALQTVVSRGLGWEGGAVVSICQFLAGEAHNVIPETAKLVGTIRTFDDAVTERVLARVREICDGAAAMFGVAVHVEIEAGYPVLYNDPHCADAVARVGRRILGDAAVSDGSLPMAGGEDFAYFARAVPSAYFFLGSGHEGQDTPVCHHPDFDFDDELIPVGMEMFLGIVADRLGLQPSASGA